MGKFSSEEIESQYNLIKMLLAEPEKYWDAIDSIKKDIAYMPIKLKKNLRKKILSYEWIANRIIIIVNFIKLANSHSRKLTEGV